MMRRGGPLGPVASPSLGFDFVRRPAARQLLANRAAPGVIAGMGVAGLACARVRAQGTAQLEMRQLGSG